MFTLLDFQPKRTAALSVCNTTSLPARILEQHRKGNPAAIASNVGVLQSCAWSAESLAVRIRKSGHLIVAQNKTSRSSTALIEATPLPSGRICHSLYQHKRLRHQKRNSSPLGKSVWACMEWEALSQLLL